MKVLFAASECAPFAASGGLGDVIGALPNAILNAHKETQVSVIMPYYDSIKKEYEKTAIKLFDIEFNLSWRKTGAAIYEIEKSGIKYLFVENS